MIGRVPPHALPETERKAFASALASMAAADGPPTLEEVLEVLARVDLDGLSEGARRATSVAVLTAPALVDDALAPLADLPAATRLDVLTEIVHVAWVDGPPCAAEDELIERIRALLDVDERSAGKAAKQAELARWEREHGIARADTLDNLWNAAVATAGFVAPVLAVLGAGLMRAPDLRHAAPEGVRALGCGLGLWAGILVAMVISVVASATVSAITQRGRRADRLRRELAQRAERLEANLGVLVEHGADRLRQMDLGVVPRVGAVALEERLDLLRKVRDKLTQRSN